MTPGPSPAEALAERLRPSALMAPGASAGHALGVLVCTGAAVGLGLVALQHLPAGLGLVLVIAPLAAWAWLALQALRANHGVRHLLARGHLVRGRVLAVEADPAEPRRVRLRYRYHVVPLATDRGPIDDATLERCALEGELGGVSRWAALRYHTGMQVGVVFEPDAPERAALLPPPGGGSPLDLVGDLFAAVLRRVPWTEH